MRRAPSPRREAAGGATVAPADDAQQVRCRRRDAGQRGV